MHGGTSSQAVFAGRSLRRLCSPARLLYHLLSTGTLGVAPGAYGPLSWPVFAMAMLVAGSALLCVLSASKMLVGKVEHTRGEPRAEMADARVVIAAALIALYGVGFVYVGYLFSTVVFIAAWLVFTRYRRPVLVGVISVLGAVLPLYLLIKVVYMPLPRGVGVLEHVTIRLYQWLGLF